MRRCLPDGAWAVCAGERPERSLSLAAEVGGDAACDQVGTASATTEPGSFRVCGCVSVLVYVGPIPSTPGHGLYCHCCCETCSSRGRCRPSPVREVSIESESASVLSACLGGPVCLVAVRIMPSLLCDVGAERSFRWVVVIGARVGMRIGIQLFRPRSEHSLTQHKPLCP